MRSADAIHLATALRVNARAMVAYDSQLHAAARTAGTDASSPGTHWLTTPGIFVAPARARRGGGPWAFVWPASSGRTCVQCV